MDILGFLDYYYHPTAVIDEECEIGPNTKIWHFCHISKGCRIGEGCVLSQNVYVAPQVVVGNGVKIQNNVSLYEGVVLEDDVFIGPSAVFTNVINPRAAVDRKDEFRPTIVKKGTTIGANATIVCGSTLGRYSFVAAGAVVPAQVVPDYALMAGVPAVQIGWMSERGCRLEFDHVGKAVCEESGEVYSLTNKRVKKT